MVEKVMAYKTHDGTLHHTKEDAERWEFVDQMFGILAPLCEDPKEVSLGLWDSRLITYNILAKYCAAQSEEAGK